MNDKFNNWQEVIVDFFENKKEAEEEKYLKDKIKEINEMYGKQNYYNDDDLRDFFDSKKNKKSKDQYSLGFQQQKLQKILEFEQTTESLDINKLKQDYDDKLEKINAKYTPHIWLTENSRNAKNVTFATHVPKLTHSKIDSPSFYDVINFQKKDQLTTSSLINKTIDGAVAGNQYAPIFQFLELELNGKKLASEFTELSNTILDDFIKNENDLETWNKGFGCSLSNDELSTHSLAKQIYFPINNEAINTKAYHLLCHVKSSSMAHKIYENVSFRENEQGIRKLRDKDKYSTDKISSFSKKAKLSVTASNHSNASQLNGKRGGKLCLFSNQPPTWQSQRKPPVNKRSMFDNYFPLSGTKENIDYLRDFLLRFEHINLSIKNPEKQEWITRWVNYIIDDFLFYVATIQNLPSGWSDAEDIKLKIEHQYLLDPNRKDAEFQINRKNNDWQAVICTDFSRWLNNKLRGKDKKFTPQKEHIRMWQDSIEPQLREHEEIV